MFLKRNNPLSPHNKQAVGRDNNTWISSSCGERIWGL